MLTMLRMSIMPKLRINRRKKMLKKMRMLKSPKNLKNLTRMRLMKQMRNQITTVVPRKPFHRMMSKTSLIMKTKSMKKTSMKTTKEKQNGRHVVLMNPAAFLSIAVLKKTKRIKKQNRLKKRIK